ncbi:MAG: hypothetical protein HFI89_09540 [Lachnospiraceae bacterium]|nr:hypothetical protein [Lachnospiraceae bacterium]
MSKSWRKLILLMILSAFLSFTGCGRSGREIVPAQETADGFGAADAEEENTDTKHVGNAENADAERVEGAENTEEKLSGKADSKGDLAERKEPVVSEPDGLHAKELGPEDTAVSAKDLHNEKMVVIHVCGAVNSPGIYRLPEGSRLWEAVEAAGGVTADGAGDYLNMAVPVTDGEKVVVPFLADVEKPFGESETLSPRPGNDAAVTGSVTGNDGVVKNGSAAGDSSVAGNGRDSAAAGLVNLNTATMEQLMTLPGIGESKAKAILEYREKTGPFAVPQDITNVPGIKEGSYEKLKGYITV